MFLENKTEIETKIKSIEEKVKNVNEKQKDKEDKPPPASTATKTDSRSSPPSAEPQKPDSPRQSTKSPPSTSSSLISILNEKRRQRNGNFLCLFQCYDKFRTFRIISIKYPPGSDYSKRCHNPRHGRDRSSQCSRSSRHFARRTPSRTKKDSNADRDREIRHSSPMDEEMEELDEQESVEKNTEIKKHKIMKSEAQKVSNFVS